MGRQDRGAPHSHSLRGFVIAFVAITALGLVVLTIARRSDTNGTQADTANRELVALGQQVYLMHCASCLGAKLKGQPNWKAVIPLIVICQCAVARRVVAP